MSLANIKSKLQSEKGFTIVELLIVVVVIAILAAITIVSYNGITTNAKNSAASAAASTFNTKAEAYNADQGRYPVSTTELSADKTKAWYYSVSTTTYGTALLSAAPSDSSTITVLKCGSGSPANQAAITSTNINGLKVSWWGFNAGSAQTTLIGDTTTCPES